MTSQTTCPHCQQLCIPEGDKCPHCQRSLSSAPVVSEVSAPASSAPWGSGWWQKLRRLGAALGLTRTPAPASSEETVELALDGPALQSLASAAAAGVLTRGSQVVPQIGVYRLEIGATTSVGQVRSRNEDSFLAQHLAWSNRDQRHEAALLVVADGMGGYEAGDLASGMLVRHLAGALAPLFQKLLEGSGASDIPQQLEAALRSVHERIYQFGQTNLGYRGMGATAVIAFLYDGQGYLSHVGDCRAYHFHEGKLVQVTQDQTLVAKLVEIGQLTPEEAEQHPQRHHVLQAVGHQASLQPVAYQVQLAAGDWLLLACDGLHAHVETEELAQMLSQAADAGLLAHQLVDLANSRGGSDNCTVLAVRCY